MASHGKGRDVTRRDETRLFNARPAFSPGSFRYVMLGLDFLNECQAIGTIYLSIHPSHSAYLPLPPPQQSVSQSPSIPSWLLISLSLPRAPTTTASYCCCTYEGSTFIHWNAFRASCQPAIRNSQNSVLVTHHH